MEDDSILRVSIPSDSLCRQVHCSLDTSFALLENGELYSWGLSTDGQLGTGCSDIDWRPTRVPIDEPLKMIAGTGDTIMALTHTGKVYVWGQAEYNQMSEFTDDPQIFYPMQVDFDFDGAGVKSVAATNTSCIIATTDGKVGFN
jgi:alpha-tubulin suppressor-like RCC1 family protein